jgi:hypothetical protein
MCNQGREYRICRMDHNRFSFCLDVLTAMQILPVNHIRWLLVSLMVWSITELETAWGTSTCLRRSEYRMMQMPPNASMISEGLLR